MARKPSTSSTRSKQHQVIRYTYSTNPKKAAKDYDVSTAKLRQFILGDPKRLKSRVQKDPAIQRLYETDPRVLAKQKKVKLVPRYSRKRAEELAYRKDLTPVQTKGLEYRTVTRVRNYQVVKGKRVYPPLRERQIQAQEVRRSTLLRGYGEYSTRDALARGLENNELTISDVRTILGIWQENYDIAEERIEDMFDDIVESSGLSEEEMIMTAEYINRE